MHFLWIVIIRVFDWRHVVGRSYRTCSKFGLVLVAVAVRAVWAQDWPLCSRVLLHGADSPTLGDSYGASLSIDGNTMALGVSGDDGNKGSVRILTYAGGEWSETQKLTGSDVLSAAHFGESVSIHGDLLVVGAPWKDAAYVFRYGGALWVEEQKLAHQ